MSDKIQDGDFDVAAVIPGLKKLLQDRVTAAKKRSDKFPTNQKRAESYKTAALQYNAFLRVIEICGRLAVQAKRLSQATDEMIQKLEDQQGSELPRDRSKIIPN